LKHAVAARHASPGSQGITPACIASSPAAATKANRPAARFTCPLAPGGTSSTDI